jgi:hypothetical protein
MSSIVSNGDIKLAFGLKICLANDRAHKGSLQS